MDGSPVRLRGVSKRYRHFALEGVDLEVARGRALGVVGQNGAGKSTLLRIVMGLVRADGRTVIFSSHRGDDVAGLADDVAFIHAGRLVGRGPAAAFAGGGRSIEEAFVEQVRGSAVGRAA